MPYVATINTPGYLPDADEPATFDTPTEAWEYLSDERHWQGEGAENILGIKDDGPAVLRTRKGEGAIWLCTPYSDSEHDLGLAYSVTFVSDNELAGVV